jgi:LDH2 family malate/lactate/ureidoglycolate dehydrogenase
MPIFNASRLRHIGCQLFEAAGCTADNAKAVVDHLVESNLFGHDSHGAIRFYEYAQAIHEGRFDPKAIPEVVKEHPCTAVVDAHNALGQVGATFASNLAIQKAREHGVSVVTLRNTSHIGRVGAYPLMAAREGFIGLIFVNAGREGRKVTPFGGRDARLSTNPIGFSAPREHTDPILLDMTTSVVADGKIRVAINQGKSIPDGWAVDSEGQATTDPNRVRGEDPQGALLPMGGVVAHKGFGLSLACEILGGVLSGQGVAANEPVMKSNGVHFTVYNIEHFTDLKDYYKEVEALVAHVKSSRPTKGFEEILIPGEPEFRCAKQRTQDGIAVDETTWTKICETAQIFGIDPKDSA